MQKLRKEFARERLEFERLKKDIVFERLKKTEEVPPTVPPPSKKLEIDVEKLEESIKRACVPVEKHGIVFIEKPPTVAASHKAPVATVVLVCQAKNLNGTPCKCKAKIGKFCAKHAP